MSAKLNFVKKARKPDKQAGIKKGDAYFWWKFRRGPIHKSKTRPPRARLTQSEFLSSMYDLEDQFTSLPENAILSAFDLQSEIDCIAEQVRSTGDEQGDKLQNMPDSLQQGSTGDLLQSRVDACEQIAGELETLADEIRDLIPDDDDKNETAFKVTDEMKTACGNISWDYE